MCLAEVWYVLCLAEVWYVLCLVNAYLEASPRTWRCSNTHMMGGDVPGDVPCQHELLQAELLLEAEQAVGPRLPSEGGPDTGSGCSQGTNRPMHRCYWAPRKNTAKHTRRRGSQLRGQGGSGQGGRGLHLTPLTRVCRRPGASRTIETVPHGLRHLGLGLEAGSEGVSGSQ